MKRDYSGLRAFEDALARAAGPQDHAQALKIFAGLWEEARTLGAIPPADPLDGIETKVRLARILNPCLKKPTQPRLDMDLGRAAFPKKGLGEGRRDISTENLELAKARARAEEEKKQGRPLGRETGFSLSTLRCVIQVNGENRRGPAAAGGSRDDPPEEGG